MLGFGFFRIGAAAQGNHCGKKKTEKGGVVKVTAALAIHSVFDSIVSCHISRAAFFIYRLVQHPSAGNCLVMPQNGRHFKNTDNPEHFPQSWQSVLLDSSSEVCSVWNKLWQNKRRISRQISGHLERRSLGLINGYRHTNHCTVGTTQTHAIKHCIDLAPVFACYGPASPLIPVNQ